MKKSNVSIAATHMTTFTLAAQAKKLIPALVLALVWGCSSKTEEKPAQPAEQPKAVAPAPEKAAEAPKLAMEAPAAPAAVEAKPAEAAPAVSTAAADDGEKIYKRACMMCHKMGVSGAPKVGDKADWEIRIKQGKETLYKHALEGFKGQKGMMPARGGNSALKDDQVKAAVDYMVSQAQ